MTYLSAVDFNDRATQRRLCVEKCRTQFAPVRRMRMVKPIAPHDPRNNAPQVLRGLFDGDLGFKMPDIGNVFGSGSGSSSPASGGIFAPPSRDVGGFSIPDFGSSTGSSPSGFDWGRLLESGTQLITGALPAVLRYRNEREAIRAQERSPTAPILQNMQPVNGGINPGGTFYTPQTGAPINPVTGLPYTQADMIRYGQQYPQQFQQSRGIDPMLIGGVAILGIGAMLLMRDKKGK